MISPKVGLKAASAVMSQSLVRMKETVMQMSSACAHLAAKSQWTTLTNQRDDQLRNHQIYLFKLHGVSTNNNSLSEWQDKQTDRSVLFLYIVYESEMSMLLERRQLTKFHRQNKGREASQVRGRRVFRKPVPCPKRDHTWSTDLLYNCSFVGLKKRVRTLTNEWHVKSGFWRDSLKLLPFLPLLVLKHSLSANSVTCARVYNKANIQHKATSFLFITSFSGQQHSMLIAPFLLTAS